MLSKLVEGQFWVSIRLSLRLGLGRSEEIHDKRTGNAQARRQKRRRIMKGNAEQM